MTSPRRCYQGLVLLALLLALTSVAAGEVIRAPGVDLTGRPISDVRIEGLQQVQQPLVRNAIRMNRGEPYDPQIVQEDIRRLTHLGRFSSVQARVEPVDDGSVVLVYQFNEQRLVSDVQVVGNKAIDDQTLLNIIALRSGDPIDPFLIERAIRFIKREYERAGYFVTDVVVDDQLMNESNILLFRVREGPKVRIRGIQFEGNKALSDRQLSSQIRARTYIFLLRSGALSREMLDIDTTRMRDFYRERGYLDAQVGRRIELSPDQRDAVVVFLIEEGAQFTVSDIRVEGNEIFGTQQILQAMLLKVGDVFSIEVARTSREQLISMYGKLGYINTQIEIERLFHEDEPKVDVRVRIVEGRSYMVGRVIVRGNQLTQDKVIYRQVRGMTPGRQFDRSGIAMTERRLRESALFKEADVLILGTDDDPYRDVLIEVKEQNTGSLSFGAGISSDAGVLGAIDLRQRNFDITDYPESFGEFITGKAFRGAGQYFAITIQPGNERSLYSVSFRDPYVFDSDYFLDTRLFFFDRIRDDFSEQRFGGNIGVGQRFGDVWEAAVRMRVEQIEITDINEDAALDVFAVEGDSLLTSAGIVLSRSTVDSRLFPTKGSIIELGLFRYGALGGDYDFTSLTLDMRKYWTVDEDFFGRKTVISIRNEIGVIFEDGEAPVFERFFAGGHRTFRGFAFRGVGPRGETMGGGKSEDSVGGHFMFLLGIEYNFPIFQELLRGVVFADTGTVQEDFGFDEYRVSIGAGIRLKIPFLGQAPFALDIAFPLIKQEDDQEQMFSFDIAVPF